VERLAVLSGEFADEMAGFIIAVIFKFLHFILIANA
jgi:hypothetical protein